jgi:hypothetical protein
MKRRQKILLVLALFDILISSAIVGWSWRNLLPSPTARMNAIAAASSIGSALLLLIWHSGRPTVQIPLVVENSFIVSQQPVGPSRDLMEWWGGHAPADPFFDPDWGLFRSRCRFCREPVLAGHPAWKITCPVVLEELKDSVMVKPDKVNRFSDPVQDILTRSGVVQKTIVKLPQPLGPAGVMDELPPADVTAAAKAIDQMIVNLDLVVEAREVKVSLQEIAKQSAPLTEIIHELRRRYPDRVISTQYRDVEIGRLEPILGPGYRGTHYEPRTIVGGVLDTSRDDFTRILENLMNTGPVDLSSSPIQQPLDVSAGPFHPSPPTSGIGRRIDLDVPLEQPNG